MDTTIKLYNLLKTDKRKERFDIILDPLQAVLQLSLLSFCPKYSKLNIANNILTIQRPTWSQGLWRSYNHDTRDDLFFIFNALMRFNRFYSFLKEESDEISDLYDLLVQLGKRGIDNLLLTYANTDQPALLHTLQMYRTLLDKPSIFNDNEEIQVNKTHHTHTKADIDTIFINIRTLYSSHEYIIMYQTLVLLEKNPEHFELYIDGLNMLLLPITQKIQKWINDNIVY